VKKITIQEDNGSFYVCVDGAQWMRSNDKAKAEEMAEAFKLAATDEDIEFVK
jgi:hypothetical protein